jgi:hypothetical protein
VKDAQARLRCVVDRARGEGEERARVRDAEHVEEGLEARLGGDPRVLEDHRLAHRPIGEEPARADGLSFGGVRVRLPEDEHRALLRDDDQIVGTQEVGGLDRDRDRRAGPSADPVDALVALGAGAVGTRRRHVPQLGLTRRRKQREPGRGAEGEREGGGAAHEPSGETPTQRSMSEP